MAEMVALFALRAVSGDATRPRYRPYGVGVQKEWLFRLGGRPVIYQPANEYDDLPSEIRWRHCRYEPPDIDFTWEREWRIAMERVDLDPAGTWVFVPTPKDATRLADSRPKWRVVPLTLFGLPT